MKQSTLLTELYQASLGKDAEKIQALKMLQYQMILERREKGKPFTTK